MALKTADTDWVTLAHQDDVYLPRFAEATVALVRNVPNASLLFTGYEELSDGSRISDSRTLKIKRLLLELAFLGRDFIRTPAAKRRLLQFGCPIPCPAVTIRRGAEILRFREDLKVNLDWDAWLRLAVGTATFGYCRERLMLHRIHAGSETSAGIRDGVRAAEDRMLFDQLWPPLISRQLARAYALSYPRGHK